MRYFEIFKSAMESEEERLLRLGIMYGVGRTDIEMTEDDKEKTRIALALDQAKTLKANADALSKIYDNAKMMDKEELDRNFPWPEPGNRSLNLSEQLAIWARCSRVAGYPLPPPDMD